MITGILKEIKVAENRVSMTPAGVEAMVSRGHTLLVEKNAGIGSGFEDKQLRTRPADTTDFRPGGILAGKVTGWQLMVLLGLYTFGTGKVEDAEIARRLRELHVYCEIHPFQAVTPDFLTDFSPKAVIFSGGPASVMDEGSPRPPEMVFDLWVPILGICYGQQVMMQMLGGYNQWVVVLAIVLNVLVLVGVFMAIAAGMNADTAGYQGY